MGAALRAAGLGAGITALTRAAVRRSPWQGSARWTRTNHRGRSVCLLAGPAVAAGALAAGLAGPSGRTRAAAAVATAGGLAFGLIDDLVEDPDGAAKGLRGHLGALAHGELTTGGVKVLGIGATGLLAAAVVAGKPSPGRRTAWVADVVSGGALVAAAANLLNLLDLRPGRALKAAALTGAALVPSAGGTLAAGVVGAAAAGLPGDLGEADMIGDAGANALGAALGVAALIGCPRPVRYGLLGAQVALTLASERVSFSRVIDRTPALRALDRWGRRP